MASLTATSQTVVRHLAASRIAALAGTANHGVVKAVVCPTLGTAVRRLPSTGYASRLTTRSASSSAGLTLYTARSKFPALNGWKLTITLEELKEAGRIPEGFSVVELDLEARQHKEPWFLEINPNGRIPALVDHTRANLAVFESCAMMLYLAESRGNGFLIPHADDEGNAKRYQVLQWLFFQASSIGPIQGQAHAFLRYVPEDVPYAQQRFLNETARLYGVLNEALSKGGPYIAGSYSIADIALFPWVHYHPWAGQSLDRLPALSQWRDLVASRPGVQRGLAYNHKDLQELLRNADEIRNAVAGSTLDSTTDSRKSGEAHKRSD